MQFPLYQVDAFTSHPFSGNPAAVCLMDGDQALDETTMQQVAAEMNLSETAYVECAPGADFATASRFKLRWFTPAKEALLCGHATLASAAAIFRGEGNKSPVLHFDTVYSGQLAVSANTDGTYCMELPAQALSDKLPDGAGADSALIQAVVGDRPVEAVLYCQALHKLVVVLRGSAGRAALEALRPEPHVLERAYTGGSIRQVVVTTAGGGDGLDFVSRAFGPWAGIDEDPVTGSAHAILAPYWRGRLGTGERALRARQCSPRGGELSCEVAGESVRLVSSAVVVFKGTLLL